MPGLSCHHRRDELLLLLRWRGRLFFFWRMTTWPRIVGEKEDPGFWLNSSLLYQPLILVTAGMTHTETYTILRSWLEATHTDT